MNVITLLRHTTGRSGNGVGLLVHELWSENVQMSTYIVKKETVAS